MNIIGLSGPMGSGKDAVASILIDRYGYHKVSVGDHVRREILEFDVEGFRAGRSGSISNSVLNALQCLTPRRIAERPVPIQVRIALQWFGYLMYRNDRFHWLHQVEDDIGSSQSDYIVFSDVRMPNEFEYCKQAGGQVWRIVKARSGINPMECNASHITEVALDSFPFDQYLANNGTLGDLSKLVCILVDGYCLRDPQLRIW